MTYSTLDIIIIAICGIFLLVAYIYGKASDELWYGIRWDNIFRSIRRSVCRLLLKFHK
jgi:hypothetical protein